MWRRIPVGLGKLKHTFSRIRRVIWRRWAFPKTGSQSLGEAGAVAVAAGQAVVGVDAVLGDAEKAICHLSATDAGSAPTHNSAGTQHCIA